MSVSKTFEDYRGHSTKADWTVVTRKDNSEKLVNGSDKEKVDFYNSNANSYDDDMQVHEYTGPLKLAEAVHRHLDDENKHILDVGAGSGLVSVELRKFGRYPNIDGLDPADKLLEIGLQKGLFAKIFPQFFHLDCGLQQDSYDALVTAGSFVPGHLRADSLYEMHKVVKPGGLIVITMKDSNLHTEPDLQTIQPIIEKLSDDGKIEVVEDDTFDGYFSGLKGHLFVLRKIRN